METKNIAWMGKMIKAMTFLMVAIAIALAGASIAFGVESVTGYVGNDTGNITGASVSLFNYTGGAIGNLLGTAASDGAGFYNITADIIPSGGIIAALNISAAGHNASWISPIVILDEMNKSVNVTLVPTGGFPTMGTLSGSVSDANGAVVGASIAVNGTNGMFSTTSIAGGAYSISLPAGTYTAKASAASHNTTSVVVVVTGGSTTSQNFALPIAVTDTTGPGPVTGLTGTATSSTSVQWTWSNPSDPDFAYVRVLLDGSVVSTQTTTSYTATGLSCGGHTATIRPYDALGNAGTERSYSVEAQACPSSSGGGGGSSSSGSNSRAPIGGSVANIINLDFAEAKSFTKTISRTDVIRFVHSQESHSMNILSISKSRIDFKIRSEVMYVSVNEGQSKNISVDGDAVPDFTLKVNKIFQNLQNVTITLSKIDAVKEPEIVVEEKPVVEEKKSTVEIIAKALSDKPSLQKGAIVTAAVAIIIFLLYLLFFVWV